MSLTDFDGNKPGGRILYGTHQRVYTRSDEPWQNSSIPVQHTRAARNRSENVKVPYRLIPGTSTPWRGASDFSRNIIWHTPGEMFTTWHYPPPRVDTVLTSTHEFHLNDNSWNEFLPLFPEGGYTKPEYDYNDRARAITECLLKIGDAKANFAESLVTYRQTVNLLADTASSLFKALLAVKRGQWGAVPKHLRLSPKGLGGRYLEWQYGWRPLASDIKTLYDLVLNRKPEAMLITARRVIKGNLEYERTGGRVDNRLVTMKTKSSYQTTCQLTGRLSDSFLRSGGQMGLTNPLLLGWELVPWSFVVDWAIPIGNVLQAYSATAGLDFVSGYTSARIQGRKTITISGPRFNGNLSGTSGTHYVDRFGFRRDALGSWPMPLPYVKSPLSSTHTANALALLLQLRK